MKRLSKEKIEQIRFLYNEKNLPCEKIARKLGIAKSTVSSHTRKMGISRNSSSAQRNRYGSELTDEEVSEIKRLYLDEELSAKKVSEVLGISQWTVSHLINKLGIARDAKSAVKLHFSKRREEVKMIREVAESEYNDQRRALINEYHVRIQPMWKEYQKTKERDIYLINIKPELKKLFDGIAKLKKEYDMKLKK